MRAGTVCLHSHHTVRVRRVKIPSICSKRLQGRPPVYRELLPKWSNVRLSTMRAMEAHPVHLLEGSSSRDLRRAETLLSARVERHCTSRKGVFEAASAAFDKRAKCDLKLNCQRCLFKSNFFCLYHKLFPLKGFTTMIKLDIE